MGAGFPVAAAVDLGATAEKAEADPIKAEKRRAVENFIVYPACKRTSVLGRYLEERGRN